MADDDFMEGSDATPSQAALDAQLQQKAMIDQAGFLGRIALARTQVSDAVAEGADAVKGRELLGQLDDMAEFPDAGDHAEVYKEFKTFIKGGAASQAAQAPPAAPAPAPKKVNSAASSRWDQERRHSPCPRVAAVAR